MPALHDELVRLAQGSDTGEANADSVQPILAGEEVFPDITNRPGENLRARTEILRRALETANYFHDYDRGLILRATGTFTFSEPVAGTYELALTPGTKLWVYPSLTPGRQSGGAWHGGRVFCANPSLGGAWTPYSGTLGVDDLTLTADRRYTGQRGYADADDFTTTPGGRTLGANRVYVTLVADPAILGGLAQITATITGDPEVQVTVTYGTMGVPTTLAQLITFINADRTSQGAYGVADYVFASSTGTTTNAPVPFTAGQIQGAYDAEAHEVSAAQLAAFFAAVDGGGAFINRLVEGAGLGVGYPAGPVEVGGTGGRRQSVYDLPTDRVGSRISNITPAAGWSLFTTYREPEKVPGAIPIGKVIEAEFVFLDGTRLGVGETLELGQSRTTLLALASVVAGADGARLVGYEGGLAAGASWHADAAATTSPELPASTVSASITRIVADLARAAAAQSGARRVGSEGIAAVVSDVTHYELALSSHSLWYQLDQLLNGTSVLGQPSGINARVSERGHNLKGDRAVKKDFSDATVSADGAEFLRADLIAPGDLHGVPAGRTAYAFVMTQPLIWDNAGDADDHLLASESATDNSALASNSLALSVMAPARYAKVILKMVAPPNATTLQSMPVLVAYLSNCANAADANDGYYVVTGFDVASQGLTFRRFTDATLPDFTGMDPGATLSFFNVVILGNDKHHTKLKAHHYSGENDAPFALLAVGDVAQPVLDVWSHDPTAGGVLKTRLSGDKAEWFPGTTTRSTNNILGATDKALLDGVENPDTLGPVDATANHHHGNFLTGFQYLDPQSVDSALVSTLSAVAPGTACVLAPPAGRTLRGVTVRYVIMLEATAAVWTTYALYVYAQSNTGPTNFLMTTLYFDWTAAAPGEQKYFYGQFVCPVIDNDSYYVAKPIAPGNITEGNSTYEFTIVGVEYGYS